MLPSPRPPTSGSGGGCATPRSGRPPLPLSASPLATMASRLQATRTTPLRDSFLPDARPSPRRSSGAGDMSEAISWTAEASTGAPPSRQRPPSSSATLGGTYPAASPKAPLATTLEEYLNRELQCGGVCPAGSPAHVRTHREVLLAFARAFPMYEELLGRIIASYDAALALPSQALTGRSDKDAPGTDTAALQRKVKELEHQLKKQTTSKGAAAGDNHRAASPKHTALGLSSSGNAAPVDQLPALRQRVQEQERSLEHLEGEREADLERVLTLINTARESETRLRVVDDELRTAKVQLGELTFLRKALSVSQTELRDLKGTYANCVPLATYQSMRTDLERQLDLRLQELRAMRRLCSLRASEIETLTARLDDARQSMERPARPATPRPRWEALLATHEDVRDMVMPIGDSASSSPLLSADEPSSAAIAEAFSTRLSELKHDLLQCAAPAPCIAQPERLAPEMTPRMTAAPLLEPAALARARQKSGSYALSSSVLSSSPVIPTLTTSLDARSETVIAFGPSFVVPPFLRACGAVVRHILTLVETRVHIVRMFDTMVRSRVDWKNPATRIAFEIHPYFRENTIETPLQASSTASPASPRPASSEPTDGAATIFGYSLLLAALEYAPTCPICRFFTRCLDGAMPAHIMFDALALYAAARDSVLKLAELHVRARIKRGPLMECLGGAFKTKTMAELEELRAALGSDSSIEVQAILHFAHPFTSVLIQQECAVGMQIHAALVERLTQHVGAALTGTDRDEMEEDDDEAARDGRVINAAHVRAALLAADEMIPRSVVDDAVATKGTREPAADGDMLLFKTVIGRINALPIKRYSPAPRHLNSPQ